MVTETIVLEDRKIKKMSKQDSRVKGGVNKENVGYLCRFRDEVEVFIEKISTWVKYEDLLEKRKSMFTDFLHSRKK